MERTSGGEAAIVLSDVVADELVIFQWVDEWYWLQWVTKENKHGSEMWSQWEKRDPAEVGLKHGSVKRTV